MNPLKRMADLVSRDPFFMGWALAQYQAHYSMADQALAEWLGCDTERLVRLALCRAPSDQSRRFQADVRRVATYANCNADQLVSLLREVAVIGSLRDTPSVGKDGFLMAARDRRDDVDSSTGTSDNESESEGDEADD